MHTNVSESSAAPLLAPDREASHPATRSRYARWFFVGMAGLFPLLAMLGFTPSYVAVHAGKATLHWFAHLHGAIMTGWLVLFFAQSLLAAKGNLRFHRKLGISAAVFGVFVGLTTVVAVVRAVIAFPPPVEDFRWDIVTLSVAYVLLFGLFFGAGVGLRKDAAAHKRLLFFATLVLLQAAVDRMPWLPGLSAAYFVRFVYLDALLIPLFVYDFVTVRRVHRTTLWCGGLVVATQVALAGVVGSPAVHRFWFERFAPYVEQVVEVKLTEAQIAPLLGDYGYPHWHITISVEDGKLFYKMPDQPRWEFGAKSETEFFLRTTAWNLSFTKGPDGRVVKLANKQPSQVWELPKM